MSNVMSDKYLTRTAEIELKNYPVPTAAEYATAQQYIYDDFGRAARYLCRDSLLEIARLILAIPGGSDYRHNFCKINKRGDTIFRSTKTLVEEIIELMVMDSRSIYMCIQTNNKFINEVATRYAHRRIIGAKNFGVKMKNARIPSTGFDFIRLQHGVPFYVCTIFKRSDDEDMIIYMHLAYKQFTPELEQAQMKIKSGLFISKKLSERHFTSSRHDCSAYMLPQPYALAGITVEQQEMATTIIQDTTPFRGRISTWKQCVFMHIISAERAFQLLASRDSNGVLSNTKQAAALTLSQRCIIQLERNNMLLSNIPEHIFDMELPSEAWLICPVRRSVYTPIFKVFTDSSTLPWGYIPWDASMVPVDLSFVTK